jgi:ubiquinone/menaquinone biosynthesis C-methylase UbiE
MKNTRISDVDWEKDIYSKGLQLNDWPFTEVVSDIMKLTSGMDKKKLRILEIGCGACNNLWFAAEVGFQISGLDISKSAIDYGKSRLEGLGFTDLDLKVGDITKLDWEDDYFDIVLDRGALTQNNYERIGECLDEAFRVLKKGSGVMLSYTLFGLNSTDRIYGREVSRNTYDFFSEGFFSRVGLTSFFTEEDLRELFSKFEDIDVKKQLIEHSATNYKMDSYSVICRK